MTDLDLGIRAFLQLAVILAVCRSVGWLLRYAGQTQVVSEMVAGVMLGPSLFGWLLPTWQAELFPMKIADTATKHPSMQILYVVSQIGLVLYMFLVGMEFDVKLLQKRAGGAIAVSAAGILVPFALGAAIAPNLVARGDCFGAGVATSTGILYMGAAMSITAFPMLARIIYERGISKTSMGTLALGAGAFDDAVAWSLLAVVLAVNKGDPIIAWKAIGGGILFGILVMTLGKMLFSKLAVASDKAGEITPTLFGLTMIALMTGAWATDALGIYAVFGAFIIGAAMPRGRFQMKIQEKIESLTVTLILPLFFVYSGLNTKIGLVNTPELWTLTIVIILLATLGKGVACGLAARASGEPWRESAAIGTLMNARGLMELIILNIGLQNGVITPTLFTIMVLMAIVTTLIASPLFLWIYGKQALQIRQASIAPEA